MDGFEGNTGVIVLGATNMPNVLDKALLRPGRFDRQITMGLPDQKGRIQILKVHAKNLKLEESVDFNDVAKRCLGMSGAELANVLNEAALLSARKKKEFVGMDDIFNAIDKIQIGLEKKDGTYSEQRQRLVAYHESGHALLGAMMDDYDLVNKVSIVPRGDAGGVTIFTPEEEALNSGMYTKEYLLNAICVTLGGRIAEEIVNGKESVTTGAQNDFQQCTNTATRMVTEFGMSDLVGPRSFANTQWGDGPGTIVQGKINEEIDKILDEQYQRAHKLLTDNRDVLDKIAVALVEHEKITGVELIKIIQKVNPDLIPEKTAQKVAEVDTSTLQAA